jgi:hypothetical protein
MFDVPSSLLQVEGRDLVADSDALVEGLVGSEAELVGQVRLTEQDEGDEGGGVHLLVEEEAELIEDIGGEEMALVDDEEDETVFAGEVSQGGLQLGLELEEVVGGFDLESEEDEAVEGRDGEKRVGEIDDVVDVAVEGLSEGAEGGGLASADIAGDEGREALLEGEGEAALGLLMAAGGEEVLGGDGLGEGGVIEAVDIIESDHRTWSPLG